jgi:hypothetical protein
LEFLGGPWISFDTFESCPFDFLGFPWIPSSESGLFNGLAAPQLQKGNSQAGLLLPGPKAIRGAVAPLGRKEAGPGRTEGIPSWAEGNPSQSEGNPSRAEGNPNWEEGNPNVYPSVKSSSFNGLRPTPAGGLGVAQEDLHRRSGDLTEFRRPIFLRRKSDCSSVQ